MKLNTTDSETRITQGLIKVREFRLTRIGIYDDPSCAGHNNVSARQGYYIREESKKEARAVLAEQFPNETFTCDEFEPLGNTTIELVRRMSGNAIIYATDEDTDEYLLSQQEDRATAAQERAIHIGEHGGDLNE